VQVGSRRRTAERKLRCPGLLYPRCAGVPRRWSAAVRHPAQRPPSVRLGHDGVEHTRRAPTSRVRQSPAQLQRLIQQRVRPVGFVAVPVEVGLFVPGPECEEARCRPLWGVGVGPPALQQDRRPRPQRQVRVAVVSDIPDRHHWRQTASCSINLPLVKGQVPLVTVAGPT
jgi:hypothetical protein